MFPSANAGVARIAQSNLFVASIFQLFTCIQDNHHALFRYKSGYRPVRRERVSAAFLAQADRSASERPADVAPPLRPPFFAAAFLTVLSLPDPLFTPPPVIITKIFWCVRKFSDS